MAKLPKGTPDPFDAIDEQFRKTKKSPLSQALIDFLESLSEDRRAEIRLTWPKESAVKCIRDMRVFPVDRYRLETDGRKWKPVATQRRMLAMQLATHADPNGTSITVGQKRLAKDTGIPLRTIARRLGELKALGVLCNLGLTKEHGTKLRRLDVKNFAEAGMPDSSSEMPDSPAAGMPDSSEPQQECQIQTGAGTPNSKAEMPDSGAEMPSKVAYNRPSLPPVLDRPFLSSTPLARPLAVPFTKSNSVVVVVEAAAPPVRESGKGDLENGNSQGKPDAKIALPEWVHGIWLEKQGGSSNAIPLRVNTAKNRDALNLHALLDQTAARFPAPPGFAELIVMFAWAKFVFGGEGHLWWPTSNMFGKEQKNGTKWPLAAFLSTPDGCIEAAIIELQRLRDLEATSDYDMEDDIEAVISAAYRGSFLKFADIVPPDL